MRIVTDKEEYSKPTIERLGSIAELTQNGGSMSGMDANWGSGMGKGGGN